MEKQITINGVSYVVYTGSEQPVEPIEQELRSGVEICDISEAPINDNFLWTKECTKLLLEEYTHRLSQFRCRNVKNKNLWKEIEYVFQNRGYNISYQKLEKKFNNMKQTYSAIKTNNKASKTGSGAIKWEWYNNFQEIFANNETFNPKSRTISSFSNENDDSTCSIPSPIPQSSINVDNMNFNKRLRLSSSTPVSPVEISNTSENSVISGLSSSESDIEGNHKTYERIHGNKTLYNFRKKQIELEEAKVTQLKSLVSNIQEMKNIQQERNQILKESNSLLRELLKNM